ncbi:MAG: glycoside hydrolase family 3 C-terminal domain-containing protein [Planctomycetota bacterium]
MPTTEPPPPFTDPDLDLEARLDDLLGRMTLEEKAAQTLHEAPAIARLGVPAYNWWNEALHGVARAGVATVFPQAIGLAAMFDPARLRRVAEVIAVEGRAKHHESARRGERGYYQGLTFWSPNVNIYRDPRWGRGHETYGECPWLTGELGVAFVEGLQGDDEAYLHTAACAKHYAVHSGPEGLRHEFDAEVNEQDLHETYLPAFRRLVVDAGVESVMGAYNRVNGEPACAHPGLMRLLREEWGFEGHFLSDCWAIRDFHEKHRVTATAPESAALAVRMGCDLNCGCTYVHLLDAAGQGLVSEAEIDACVRRLMRTRLRLGAFDPPERVPYAATPYDRNDCAEHAAVSLDATRASLVLLRNDGTLPLEPGETKRLAVIGPNAAATKELLANYHGTPSRTVTVLDGLRSAFGPAGAEVRYTAGCTHDGEDVVSCVVNAHPAETIALAEWAEAAVVVLGLHAGMEGEQGDAGNADASGDRRDVALPEIQLRTLRRVLDTGTPTVVVLVHGGPVTLGGLEHRCAAIVDAFYPGPHAGTAVAEVLTGALNPAGRLPMTYPRGVEDLPAFEDYAMARRTYRFAEGAAEPLYPFGFGLGYSRFAYDGLSAEWNDGGGLRVSATVRNVGDRFGEEVAQLYVQLPTTDGRNPGPQLRGVKRLSLEPGASQSMTFEVPASELRRYTATGWSQLNGPYRVFVGGSQPDPRSVELMGVAPLSVTLDLKR